MLLDDEAVPLVVGECLVHLPREEAEERLQTRECGLMYAPAWRPSPNHRSRISHARPPRSPRRRAVQDEARAEAKALDAEAAGLRGQLAGLKAELYARFGSAINLEE